jgi:hypothetical protein
MCSNTNRNSNLNSEPSNSQMLNMTDQWRLRNHLLSWWGLFAIHLQLGKQILIIRNKSRNTYYYQASCAKSGSSTHCVGIAPSWIFRLTFTKKKERWKLMHLSKNYSLKKSVYACTEKVKEKFEYKKIWLLWWKMWRINLNEIKKGKFYI